MAFINLEFNGKNISNNSAQVGDNVYYVNTSTVGGFKTGSSPVEMGKIKSIAIESTKITMVIDLISSDIVSPTTDSFIFFNKENIVNSSSMRGYFGEVEFKNDSIAAAELFAASCEVVPSSK